MKRSLASAESLLLDLDTIRVLSLLDFVNFFGSVKREEGFGEERRKVD